jgi:ATP-binding cassette subfamily B protein
MATSEHADPPAGIHSLWRLRGYLRPHARALSIMVVAALGAVGLTITIPLVTKAIIDGPIADRDLGALLPLGLLALGLGVLEAVLIWVRRWVQSTAVLGLETEIRHDLYERLQQLPMSFHTGWVYWPLGLVVAAAAFPIIWLSMRFEKTYVVVSRRVQDEQGDLATLAEEGAVGIRVIKSFGRSDHVSEQYESAARQLHDTSMDKDRLSAKFWTFLEVIPNVAVVIVLLMGAIGVGKGLLTPGELVAFIALLLSLVWPVASLGVILAMAQGAMTASARILEIFDTEPDIVGGTRLIAEPRGHLRFEGVDFAFPDSGGSVLRGLDLEIRPGETVALVGATGSGKSVLTSLVPRLYDVTGAGSPSTASTCASWISSICARLSRPPSRTPRCSR